MIGRGDEQARVDRLLEDASGGQSGCLVVRGEPGIGKTSLLDYAVERAGGFRVLRALGMESESELAFSGLLELFRPEVGRLAGVSDEQAAALSAALALGDRARVDQFSVYAATLSLVAEIAEGGPLLCVIDDAQWIDCSSGEALMFTARRLGAEGVVMLFGVRDGEPARFEIRGVPEITLHGLEATDARRLLEQACQVSLADSVAVSLVAATGGNPLALIEVPRALSESQRLGREPLRDPLLGGAGVERAFGARAAKLSSGARRALLIAAISDTGQLAPILTAAGEDASSLDEAEAAGLIRVDGDRLAFRHPLVRSAVHGQATGGQRRAAQADLADALAAVAPERAAWHRALATIGYDEKVAADLAHVAEGTRRRGGADAQARLLERAARLTADVPTRAMRLHAAGRAAYHAGRPSYAAVLLDEGLDLATDPLLRADLVEGRAEVARAAGDIAVWVERCAAEAESVEAIDPQRASALLYQVHDYLIEQFETVAARDVAARVRALAVAHGDDPRVLTTHAWQAMLDDEIEEARKLALRGATISTKHPTERATEFAWVLLFVGEYDAARALLDAVIPWFRREGAIVDLAKANQALSHLEYRLGRLAEAAVAAREAVDLSEQAALPYWICDTTASLAMVEATLGREADFYTHYEAVFDLALRVGLRSAATNLTYSRGHLALIAGRVTEAITHLEQVRNAMVDVRARFWWWAPDLVEAYSRAQRPQDAEDLLTRFESESRQAGHELALAIAARCRALLSGDDYESAFAHALRLCQDELWAFERARCELLFGERLRRSGQRATARAQLRSALNHFERAGASGFAERARRELQATGVTVRRRDPALIDQLTPQELQIAVLVAQGATNREVAASVFLSTKTVEKHLSSAYRKLGVRSRSELAGRFSQP